MKKIISTILTLAMLVSAFALFPATALAAGDELTIAGTVAVQDGNIVVSSGTNWSLASSSSAYTLTVSGNLAGDIAAAGLGTLNISVTGNANVNGVTGDTDHDSISISGSGSLTCGGNISAKNVTITGGTVTAAGISSGTGGAVSITGGNVKAAVAGKTPTVITLSGLTGQASVTVIGGVTYGTDGMKTLDTNKIYIYLPSGQTVTSVTAGGKTYYGSAAAGGTATFARRVTGTISFSGTVAVGSTLMASVSNPDPSDATFVYKWYRDRRATTEIASGTTYTVVEADIGSQLLVEASCTNYAGDVISDSTGTVPKLSESAKPATPTTLPGGVGSNYITAGAAGAAGKTIELQARYASDSTAATGWLTQTGSTVTFTGLAANTAYKIYARYKETATRTNGPDSEALSVTTTQRITPVDPVASNMIYGVYDGNVFERSRAISFIAIGGGMDNTAPLAGDTRYVPINWFVNPSGVWVTAPYYATIPANSLKVGWHTLTVTYRRQVYSGTAWVSQTTAPQTVTATVTFYITGSNNPKTGEDGGVWLYAAIIAGVALVTGSAIAISARRRKNTQ